MRFDNKAQDSKKHSNSVSQNQAKKPINRESDNDEDEDDSKMDIFKLKAKLLANKKSLLDHKESMLHQKSKLQSTRKNLV